MVSVCTPRTKDSRDTVRRRSWFTDAGLGISGPAHHPPAPPTAGCRRRPARYQAGRGSCSLLSGIGAVHASATRRPMLSAFSTGFRSWACDDADGLPLHAARAVGGDAESRSVEHGGAVVVVVAVGALEHVFRYAGRVVPDRRGAEAATAFRERGGSGQSQAPDVTGVPLSRMAGWIGTGTGRAHPRGYTIIAFCLLKNPRIHANILQGVPFCLAQSVFIDRGGNTSGEGRQP
jgi:hypothetical protein